MECSSALEMTDPWLLHPHKRIWMNLCCSCQQPTAEVSFQPWLWCVLVMSFLKESERQKRLTNARTPVALQASINAEFLRHLAPSYVWRQDSATLAPSTIKAGRQRPSLQRPRGMKQHFDYAGQLHCFGDNYSGQCTIPEGLGHCQAVAAGFRHTCVITEDCSLVCFGDNGALARICSQLHLLCSRSRIGQVLPVAVRQF